MKKVIFFIGFLLPLSVSALSASPTLSCDKSALKEGEVANCNISVSISSGSLNSFSGKVTLSSNLELISASSSSIWQGNGNGGVYELYTDTPKTGSASIGSFSVKAKSGYNSNGVVTLANISLGDENFSEISKGNLTQTLRAKSTKANLTSLSVSGETLSPSFNPDTKHYTLTTTSSHIRINASGEGTISGTGYHDVKYGNNKYDIVVTAEAGNTKVYTITVTRPDNRSNINTLNSLEINQAKIDFSKEKTSYDITVAPNVNKLDIKSTLTDSKSKYSSGSNSMSVNLNYGLNSIKIVVEAENGASKTYTINVTRTDDRSTNNNLTSIGFLDKKINVIENKLEYEINVLYSVEQIKLKPKVQDKKSKVEVNGPEKLAVGENIYEIKVFAENESLKTYIVKVFRYDESVVFSSDSTLKSLKIDGYEIKFDKNVKEYTLKTNDKALSINVQPNDSKATYEILNNKNLKEGSIISIVVTAEDESNTEYKIIIEKLPNYQFINYLIFGIAELVLVFLCMNIFKKIKNNKNKVENKIE